MQLFFPSSLNGFSVGQCKPSMAIFFLQALHGFSLVPSSLQWLFVIGSPSLQWLLSNCKPVMAM